MWVCLCVSLQEAELAARILLDRGQVTAWGSQGVGGKKGHPPNPPPQGKRGPPTWLSPLLLFLLFQSLPIPVSAFSFPSSPFSGFLGAFQPFIILFYPQNHLHCKFNLPKLIFFSYCICNTLFPSPLSAPLPFNSRPLWRSFSCLFSSQPNSYLMVICFPADSLCGDTLWLCHFYCLWHPQTQTPSDTHLP